MRDCALTASFRFLLGFALSSAVIVSSADADSQRAAPLLGGEFTELQSGPVAAIMINDGDYLVFCSGLLVGQQEILTAAHCTASFQASQYTIFIGHGVYGVVAATAHPNYDDNGPVVEQNLRYDVGVLTLDRQVTNVVPIPIMDNLSLRTGDGVNVYGYGLNESSGSSNRPILEDGKSARLSVEYVNAGMLYTYHISSSASACAGDSGGPLLQTFGRYSAVVGVVSAGTNGESAGNCTLGFLGESLFVDLQSQYVKSFLRRFSGINWISGRSMRFQAGVEHALNQAAATIELQSKSKIRSQMRSIFRDLRSLRSYTDSSRKRKWRLATRTAKRAARTRKYTKLLGLRSLLVNRINRLAQVGL